MILWVDACDREASRTERLTKKLLSHLSGEVCHLELYKEPLPVIDGRNAERRSRLAHSGRFDDDLFAYARRFAEADTVVFSAPLWDLSFPAVLKKYIEAVSVSGLTFKYDEHGAPVGLCRAKKMFYVTTAGGRIFAPEYGYGYIKTLCEGMFGIRDSMMFSAENLDIIGADTEAIMTCAEAEIDRYFVNLGNNETII